MRILLSCLVLLFSFVAAASPWDPVAYVDPFIGTAADGAVNPGASSPFGMVQWSPVTPSSPIGSYQYEDQQMTGMSLTHLSGTGCPNANELPILPTVGPDTSVTAIAFSHEDESASPGYYRVKLANRVTVELTATSRTGMARYTFPSTAQAGLILDAGHSSIGSAVGQLKPVGPRELEGWTQGGHFCGSNTQYTVYFVIQTDRDILATAISGAKQQLTFDSRQQRGILLKVGLSYVSTTNARANLAAENNDWNFDKTRGATVRSWRQRLSAIRVFGGTADRLKVFYTALYHAFLHPNVFNDVNGEYIGFDGKVYRNARPHYANYSLWDIYRSQLQLVAWLFPEIGSDLAQSLVADAEQCGALPKWTQNNIDAGVMVGDPGPAAVATLYAFGGKNFDTASALRSMLQSGLQAGTHCNDVPIRPGMEDYLRVGYVPQNENGVWGSVSTSLEYVVSDFTIAAFAHRMGDAASEQKFLKQSNNWTNLFYPTTGLLQAKDGNGAWIPGVTESTTDGYVEGSAVQYLWYVPHDAHQLIALLGGDSAAVARLDHFFLKLNAGADQPYLYIGNEPGFWAPFFYLWAHAPWRTQDVVRRIVDETFLPVPHGLPGNDDLGATSSWLVWGSLGLFPMVPGVSGLAVASPAFPRIVVHMGNQKKLTIEAPAAPARYVWRLTIDGRPYDRAWLDESLVTDGGKLRFTLSEEPSLWGSGADTVPESFLGADR